MYASINRISSYKSIPYLPSIKGNKGSKALSKSGITFGKQILLSPIYLTTLKLLLRKSCVGLVLRSQAQTCWQMINMPLSKGCKWFWKYSRLYLVYYHTYCNNWLYESSSLIDGCLMRRELYRFKRSSAQASPFYKRLTQSNNSNISILNISFSCCYDKIIIPR